MPRWYVSIESKASGPFETAEVIESIRQRKYVLVDLVFQEGGSLWQSFDEIVEFKQIFDDIKAQDESRSKANSHLTHTWVLLKKTKADGPAKYLQEGPYSTEEVLNQIYSGVVQYSDYAWKKGFDKWVRIGFVPDFDRMRDLDENSFVGYKIPLPEISDPDVHSTPQVIDDMLNSVRILKKDETFYEKPEDDPDFATAKLFGLPPGAVHQMQELEVTSVGPVDFSPAVLAKEDKTPPPPPEITEDTMKLGFNGDFQAPQSRLTPPPLTEDSHIGDLMKKGITVDLKNDSSERNISPQDTAELEEPTELIKKVSEVEKPNKKKSKKAEKAPPVEKTKGQTAGEKKKSSFLSSLMEKTAERAPEPTKLVKEAQKKTQKIIKSPPDDFANSRENPEETSAGSQIKRKSRNVGSIFMSLFSIFALIAIVFSGVYNYRTFLFGENSKIEKSVDTIQRFMFKLEEPQGEVKVAPYKPATVPAPPPPPPTPTPTQAQATAAQDPNLKAKVENQLESGANQKLPDTNLPQGPTQNSDMVRPGQKASYVDIDLKNFSKNSKAVVVTNGSIGTVVLVYISARTGEILTFPSFYREYKVTKRSSKNMELDLSSLAPGKYNVEAEIGDLKRLRTLSVKEDDFNKKIEAHLKQVSYEQQKEKKALFYGAKALETLLKKLFENARTAKTQSKDWAGFYSGFRQSTKSSLSSLVTSLNDSNRNSYAYPDEIFDLLEVKDNLLKTAEDVDRSIKQKKTFEAKVEQDIIRDLEKIRKRAAILSVRKSLN